MTDHLPFGDHPIETFDQDELDRSRTALALADELASLDARYGAVAAITGPWGSGKTSLMNLVATELRTRPDVRVVEFNPWLFSGAEELASLFLNELAAQLVDLESRTDSARRVSGGIAQAIGTYSSLLGGLKLIPGVGSMKEAFDSTLQAATGLLQGDQSVAALRRKTLKTLSELDGRIVVLVDDIDRLTRSETRQLFRTVRLTASFPNVIYLLCLDRQVVERALDEDGFSGRAYLEKILTITCAVPVATKFSLRRNFLSHSTGCLNSTHTGTSTRIDSCSSSIQYLLH